MNRLFGLPLPVLTDAYKLSHFKLYPDAKKMVCYGEFRTSYEKDSEDHRIVYYGMRYIITEYIAKKWTIEDVERTEKFLKTFNAVQTPFPFPKHLFEKFIRENDGYFPVKIESLPEGSVVYPHVPVFQVTADEEYSGLVTYLETVLTMVWYPSTVATLSRRSRTIIQDSFNRTVDPALQFLVSVKMHDFGFRGCTSLEQSVIGGCAHLLSFEGSDTLSAAYYGQYMLNSGKQIASSIPATEHSVMTAFPTEREAMEKAIETYGDNIVACVMDSYDYTRALSEILPSVASLKLEKGGMLVLRPDSGDQVETVVMGLLAGEKVFGSTVNSKGFKVIEGCSVIQGDGVTPTSLAKILAKVEEIGFSAQNVAFGMGGGLLQKVNRDTMSFATKLSLVIYADGTRRDIMKIPKSDSKKISLPGAFVVFPTAQNDTAPMVHPKYSYTEGNPEIEYGDKRNLLKVVYDKGPIEDFVWDDFDIVRQRLETQWNCSPLKFDPISDELKVIRENVIKNLSIQ